MKTGVIKFFNSAKGYGFIKEDGTGNEIFLHVSGLVDQDVKENDRVSFEISQGRKGANAVNVRKM